LGSCHERSHEEELKRGDQNGSSVSSGARTTLPLLEDCVDFKREEAAVGAEAHWQTRGASSVFLCEDGEQEDGGGSEFVLSEDQLDGVEERLSPDLERWWDGSFSTLGPKWGAVRGESNESKLGLRWEMW
jgi:hypothetical protein